MHNTKNSSFQLKGRQETGFTLIELMITVAIIGILAAVGYPSYTKHTIRANRSEGRAHLMDAAAILERYYSDNNRYAAADNTIAPGGIAATTETGKYNITIATTGTYQTYTLTATPTFTDTECGNLTLTQAGVKGKSGTASVNDCWGK